MQSNFLVLYWLRLSIPLISNVSLEQASLQAFRNCQKGRRRKDNFRALTDF